MAKKAKICGNLQSNDVEASTNDESTEIPKTSGSTNGTKTVTDSNDTSDYSSRTRVHRSQSNIPANTDKLTPAANDDSLECTSTSEERRTSQRNITRVNYRAKAFGTDSPRERIIKQVQKGKLIKSVLIIKLLLTYYRSCC